MCGLQRGRKWLQIHQPHCHRWEKQHLYSVKVLNLIIFDSRMRTSNIFLPWIDRSHHTCPSSPSIYSRWAHRVSCNQTIAGCHCLFCIWSPRALDPLEQRWHEARQYGTGIHYPSNRSKLSEYKSYFWNISKTSTAFDKICIIYAVLLKGLMEFRRVQTLEVH